ncbi:MAG: hypothetical protein KDC01_05115 [Flavobacteriales bacterium]|jgi:hypothetical protein|nr:hypothetical protein [Flavobacteriales bacterium]
MRARNYWILLSASVLLSCGGGAPAPSGPPPSLPAMAPREHTEVVNGPERILAPDGSVQMEGNKKNGLRHGVWTSYFPDGRVRSRNEYREGKLEGLSTVFRENGALLYSGQHRNDKQVGEWRFHDEQGNLERTVVYDTAGAVINDPGEGGS